MPGPTIRSFSEVLALSERVKRKLLLGNGFSMAWDAKRFAYGSLFERARLRMPQRVQATFDALGTKNFELVMKVLRDAAKIADLYLGIGSGVAKQMQSDADQIREALINAIAENHPDKPSDVTDSECVACRQFLANFTCWYTLNYDLLLYWVLMRHEVTPGLALKCDDGFRMPYSGPDAFVTWEVERTNRQSLHYLHGGLHIFDTANEIQKFTWINTGKRLIDQIREALADEKFPLFVSEGSSREKKDQILHNGFLHKSLRSISNIGGTLFFYGVSLAENDEHILQQLERGTNELTVAVGLYKPTGGMYDSKVIARAQQLESARAATGSSKRLNVIFFDAASVNVWGR